MILDILDHINSDTKRSHKLSVLGQHLDNQLFKDVLRLALDPYIQFYIRKIPAYSASGEKSLEWALGELSKLYTRELTGNAGISHLTNILSSLTSGDATVVERIIGKDLRAGIADATVNAVFTGLIPTYPCLLARPYDDKNIKNIVYPAISQYKGDGIRINVWVEGTTVTLRGRSGRIVDLHGCLDDGFLKLKEKYGRDMVFDGELVILGNDGKLLPRKIGNGIANKAIKGTITKKEAEMSKVLLWDAIPVDEFKGGKSKQPYGDRFGLLENNIDGSTKGHSTIPYKYVNNLSEAQEHFQEVLASGDEGTILKNITGLWEDTRSKHLVKFKAELSADLEIIGHNPGEGKFTGLVGSLICASSDRGVEVSISGFSDDLRREITTNIEKLIGKIVTIKYNERIKSQSSHRAGVDSLFLPRFLCFRDDKTVADSCSEIPLK